MAGSRRTGGVPVPRGVRVPRRHDACEPVVRRSPSRCQPRGPGPDPQTAATAAVTSLVPGPSPPPPHHRVRLDIFSPTTLSSEQISFGMRKGTSPPKGPPGGRLFLS